MTPRQSYIYLLWYGAKDLAGDAPTPEEVELFIEARNVSIVMAKMTMGITEKDYKYTKGKGYGEE